MKRKTITVKVPLDTSMRWGPKGLAARPAIGDITGAVARFGGLDARITAVELIAALASLIPGAGLIPIAGVGGTIDMGWLDSAVVTQAELTTALGALTASMIGRYIGTTVLTVGSGTFTTGGTTNTIRVRLIAGGGGGGGCTSAAGQAAAGGGGGAGGYAEKTFAVTPSTGYAYTVGALGAKGANTGADGSPGSDSTFGPVGGVTVTAKGGLGGKGMLTGTTVLYALGGVTTPISTNGDVNGSGAPGTPGVRATGLIAISGQGGSCGMFGGGGPAFMTTHNGAPGNGYGGGGGGGNVVNGGGAVTGGDGLNGVIIIEEFT